MGDLMAEELYEEIKKDNKIIALEYQIEKMKEEIEYLSAYIVAKHKKIDELLGNK